MSAIDSSGGINRTESVLDALCGLAYGLVKVPVTIWIKDPLGKTIVPQGQAGLGPEILTEATAEVGDGSLIDRIIATGEEETLPDVRRDPVLGRCRSLPAGDRRGLIALPARWRSETLGVVGLFGLEPNDLDQSLRPHLVRIASLAGEQAGRGQRARLLAMATRVVAESPDLYEAMDVIVETARSLTACDASVLWLLDGQTDRFVLGSHSTDVAWPTSRPRDRDGLTRAILEQGESVRIDDARGDGRVRKELVEAGICSLVGVPIKRQEETIGVLFVNSLKPARFTPNDVYLLEAVAGQVSAGLGWAHRLLTMMDDVERAIARLFTLEDTLRGLCKRIRAETGFDYVAVQLVRPEERTIETVFSTGGDMDWTGIARHAMDTPEELRDIQVDVVRSHPRRIEVIHGPDPRFDAWIYEHWRQQDYVRAWVPMLLVRDGSGQLKRSWWQDAHWEQVPEESLPEGGWRYALELRTDIEEHYPRSYALGTLEAGYKGDPGKRITPEQTRQLADLVSEGAIEVRAVQLPSVLETVADGLRRILRADAASLHFSYAPNPTRPDGFAYEVAVGNHGLRFFHRAKPGHHRLGQEAIERQRSGFVPDERRGEKADAVKKLAPNLYDQGIRAIAAFPLVVDRRRSILYVYFHTDHRFTEDEIRWGKAFSQKAEDAIRNATRELRVRDQTRYLANMYGIARMMATETESDQLLKEIAGYAANILAADLVTIYEYLESRKQFFSPPARSGRLIDKETAYGTVPEEANRIIEDGEIHYVEDCWITRDKGGFVDREGIKSRILCPLRDRTETVGVMFVDYRSPRRFGMDDREVLVPTLVAAAAMTIRTARANEQIQQALIRKTKEQKALHRVDQAIVTGAPDNQQVMRLILREAMDITDAKVGFFFQYDRWQKRLDLVAQHGSTEGIRFDGQRLSEGIVGQVVQTRQAVLVEDVLAPEWRDSYHPIVPETRAELAVPLQDKDDLWGILNMEHSEPGAFGENDLGLLETFATQAMIAVHSVDLYKQLERQIRPLRSLSVIYSHMQDPRHDLDTILRRLLTGVTAGTGLDFSRALLFLNDEREDMVHGKMAIGARTRQEADAIWGRLKIRDAQFPSPDKSLDWYLEQAERFEADLRAGRADDRPLSKAVKQQGFSPRGLGGAFQRCLNERRAVIVKDGEPDPFRRILREITNTDDEERAFACVPLVGRAKTEGVLVVDHRFLMAEREIDERDRISLEAYAGVAAMAIENLDLCNRSARERENAWRDFARQAAHSIGNRIAQAEGSAFRLEESLEDVVGDDHRILFDRLQDAFETTKELLTRWRELLKPTEPDRQRLDLRELLKKVDEENQDRLGAVRLTIDSPEPPMELMGDPLLLTDAFAELIKNAIESMEGAKVSDPAIAIRAYREGSSDWLRIEVVNPGPGIPGPQKQSIFEPFSTTKGRQRGLGLASIKQAIEAHGGAIEETGTLGEFARFAIRLPALNTELPNQ